MANLDVIENDGLVAQAGARGAYTRGRLHAAFDGHPLVGEVRGAGLVAAVELIADRATRTKFDPALKVGPRTARHALDEGLVTRGLPAGDALSFSPPFVITEAEIDEVVARFDRALARTMDELTREGVRIAA